MFQFPGLSSPPYFIQAGILRHDPEWVPPFGDLRVEGCVPLAGDYRSLPRPSSTSYAKASAVRPWYLNLLTRVYEESKFFLVLSHELEHTFRDRVRHDANHHMNFLLLSHWDQLMVMIISMCATPRPRRRALCNCQGARGPAPWVPDAAMGDAGRRPFADAKS